MFFVVFFSFLFCFFKPKKYRYFSAKTYYTVFSLITTHAPISAQSSNLGVFTLQPVHFYLLLYKNIRCGYSFELPRQVEAIQMSGYSFELPRQVEAIQTSTHNICFHKEIQQIISHKKHH